MRFGTKKGGSAVKFGMKYFMLFRIKNCLSRKYY